jgi:hypothetical protein
MFSAQRLDHFDALLHRPPSIPLSLRSRLGVAFAAIVQTPGHSTRYAPPFSPLLDRTRRLNRAAQAVTRATSGAPFATPMRCSNRLLVSGRSGDMALAPAYKGGPLRNYRLSPAPTIGLHCDRA